LMHRYLTLSSTRKLTKTSGQKAKSKRGTMAAINKCLAQTNKSLAQNNKF
jgi:hypothetical protein